MKPNKLIDTENRLMVFGGRDWEVDKMAERIKRYKVSVIK